MAHLGDDDAAPRPGERAQGELVRQRAGRHEHRRLLAEDARPSAARSVRSRRPAGSCPRGRRPSAPARRAAPCRRAATVRRRLRPGGRCDRRWRRPRPTPRLPGPAASSQPTPAVAPRVLDELASGERHTRAIIAAGCRRQTRWGRLPDDASDRDSRGVPGCLPRAPDSGAGRAARRDGSRLRARDVGDGRCLVSPGAPVSGRGSSGHDLRDPPGTGPHGGDSREFPGLVARGHRLQCCQRQPVDRGEPQRGGRVRAPDRRPGPAGLLRRLEAWRRWLAAPWPRPTTTEPRPSPLSASACGASGSPPIGARSARRSGSMASTTR